jgi:hypothetical protein
MSKSCHHSHGGRADVNVAILHASQDAAMDAHATLKTMAAIDSRRSVVKVTCAGSSSALVLRGKDTRVALNRQGGAPAGGAPTPARDLPEFLDAMTVRILIERSAADRLRDLATATVQAATLTGYGFLLAALWMLLAGKLY